MRRPRTAAPGAHQSRAASGPAASPRECLPGANAAGSMRHSNSIRRSGAPPPPNPRPLAATIARRQRSPHRAIAAIPRQRPGGAPADRRLRPQLVARATSRSDCLHPECERRDGRRQAAGGEGQAQRSRALRGRDHDRLTAAQGRFEMGRKFQQRDPVLDLPDLSQSACRRGRPSAQRRFSARRHIRTALPRCARRPCAGRPSPAGW